MTKHPLRVGWESQRILMEAAISRYLSSDEKAEPGKFTVLLNLALLEGNVGQQTALFKGSQPKFLSFHSVNKFQY